MATCRFDDFSYDVLHNRILKATLKKHVAYLKNLESRGGADSNCEGILLYAAVDQNVDFRFPCPAMTFG